jgi:RNA polymerase sigma-70 factor (ECF subfamily)
MPTSLSDQDLVHEAQAGSRAAAELLIRRHERRVYRVCLAMTRHADDALDLTQDALLRAFSKLDSFDGRGSVEGWLIQVTNRICLNWLRRRGRRPETEELTELNAPASAPDQETGLARREAGERLRLELARLGDRERRVLGLRYFQQMPIREVAATLGCSEGTAKSLLFRTLRKLRERMAAERDAIEPMGDHCA